MLLCFSLTSIKTRIETIFSQCLNSCYCSVLVSLPLKQGLKPILNFISCHFFSSCFSLTSIKTRIETQQKHGHILMIMNSSFSLTSIKTRIETKKLMNLPLLLMNCFSLTSIKTRIATTRNEAGSTGIC